METPEPSTPADDDAVDGVHAPETDGEDLEQDPSRNPDEDVLEDIKGG